MIHPNHMEARKRRLALGLFSGLHGQIESGLAIIRGCAYELCEPDNLLTTLSFSFFTVEGKQNTFDFPFGTRVKPRT